MDRILWTEEGSETQPLETMSSRSDLTSFHSCKKYFCRTLSLESCSSSSCSSIGATATGVSLSSVAAAILLRTHSEFFILSLSTTDLLREKCRLQFPPGLHSLI